MFHVNMMELYTERYEVVIVEQPSKKVLDGVGPTFSTVAQARAWRDRSTKLIDSCEYAIRKTTVSYLV